jgi:hypothetical protein
MEQEEELSSSSASWLSLNNTLHHLPSTPSTPMVSLHR